MLTDRVKAAEADGLEFGIINAEIGATSLAATLAGRGLASPRIYPEAAKLKRLGLLLASNRSLSLLMVKVTPDI